MDGSKIGTILLTAEPDCGQLWQGGVAGLREVRCGDCFGHAGGI